MQAIALWAGDTANLQTYLVGSWWKIKYYPDMRIQNETTFSSDGKFVVTERLEKKDNGQYVLVESSVQKGVWRVVNDKALETTLDIDGKAVEKPEEHTYAILERKDDSCISHSLSDGRRGKYFRKK